MTSYRDLLVDVLDDTSSTIDSPAIARARSAIGEQTLDGIGLGADRYYRDLLADVVGDLWPAPHSAATADAYAALVREPLSNVDEHHRRCVSTRDLARPGGRGR